MSKVWIVVLLLSACRSGAGNGPAPMGPASPPAGEKANAAGNEVSVAKSTDRTQSVARPAPGKMGTAHPFVFESGSYAFNWVVGCQPRKDTDGDGSIGLNVGHHGRMFGDRLEAFYFAGGGEGEAIDTFVGSDASGRFLAFVQGGALVVVDAEKNRRHDLSALGFDAGDDDNPTLHHAALAFGPGGRAAVIRRDLDKNEVALFDPQTGQSTTVYESTEMVWRVDFKPGGKELAVWEVRADTDKNGTIEFPRAQTTLAPRHCRGAPMSYGVYGWSNDKPEEVVVKIQAASPPAAAETLTSPPKSVKNGVAASDAGGVLVGASSSGSMVHGPLEWVQP